MIRLSGASVVVIETLGAFVVRRRLVADMPAGEDFELDVSLTGRARPPADLLPEMDARPVSTDPPGRIERTEFGRRGLLPQDAGLAYRGGHELVADVQPRMGAEERGAV